MVSSSVARTSRTSLSLRPSGVPARLAVARARHISPSSASALHAATDGVRPSRLLIPALRADSTGGFDGQWSAIEAALTLGVGGFILFGGSASNVARLVSRLQQASLHPLLIGSDLERGAGQQFAGATSLPPPAALAAINDVGAAFEAGRITAAEAASLGVNWVMAPVADLDIEPRNPIVATRSFGSDPARVATLVAAWVRGCREGGCIACVKHFPGHGRSTSDSHVEQPIVECGRDVLLSTDIVPFRSAFEAGAGSVMTAHVAYPALDPSHAVATLSPPIIGHLLRGELGFQGVVASDALGMAGLSGGVGEGEAAVRALEAGCDLLLYPEHLEDVVAALDGAIMSGRVTAERIGKSIERVEHALAGRVASSKGEPAISAANCDWADATALRSLQVLRGSPGEWRGSYVVALDDDTGGPHPAPSRSEFQNLLGTEPSGEQVEGMPLVAIYSDPRAWKGRAGLSETLLSQARSQFERWPAAPLVLFGHPRLLESLPTARHVLCAWGGEPVMQRAAARWLLSREGARVGRTIAHATDAD